MKKEEFVKAGISEELAAKLEEASLEELKGFIPKGRFDEVNNEKKKLEETLKERDGQLEALKDAEGDADALKKQIEELTRANKEKDEAHAAEVKQLKLDAAVDSALSLAKARNSKAAKALLNLEGAELSEDGSVKGLKEQIEALIKSDAYLFDIEQAADGKKGTIKGAKPNDIGTGAVAGADTSKMTYTELAAYMAAHPDAQI